MNRSVANLKLVWFVPLDALDETRAAVFAAGGGRIGGYERCSWYTVGTGTFLGGEGTSPALGESGREESVPELRVWELPAGSLDAAYSRWLFCLRRVGALLRSHRQHTDRGQDHHQQRAPGHLSIQFSLHDHLDSPFDMGATERRSGDDAEGEHCRAHPLRVNVAPRSAAVVLPNNNCTKVTIAYYHWV
jgi:hypothetical protein